MHDQLTGFPSNDRPQNKFYREQPVPEYYRFVDTLPYTPNNKYDFCLLEKLGNEYVSKQNGSN